MKDVIFAKPSHKYDSYRDLYRLVELAGFPICSVKEMDLDRDVTYVTSPVDGETRAHCGSSKGTRKAKVIFWCLERPDSGNYPPDGIGAANRVDEILKFVDHVWVSDKHYASLDPRLIYVTLGSDARLAEGPSLPIKVYDIAALTYNNERRSKIYGPLGKRWKMAPESAWGETRAKVLHSSRCMLYVHQTPMPIGAPLRFALAAAYKLPLISEEMTNTCPLLGEFDFLTCRYEEMVEKIEVWLTKGWLSELGKNLHQTLCVSFPFRGCVEEGLRRTIA